MIPVTARGGADASAGSRCLRLGRFERAVSQGVNVVEAIEDLLVVCNHNDSGATLRRDLAQQVHHRTSSLRIERGGRLVREDDPRIIGERTSDRNPLRLAT